MESSKEDKNEEWQESTHQDNDKDVTNYARNATSGTGEGTGDLSSNSSKRPHSVVWKFFSLLDSGKSVQCQLCGNGNKDGLLSYNGGTTLMREHLKRCHIFRNNGYDWYSN